MKEVFLEILKEMGRPMLYVMIATLAAIILCIGLFSLIHK